LQKLQFLGFRARQSSVNFDEKQVNKWIDVLRKIRCKDK